MFAEDYIKNCIHIIWIKKNTKHIIKSSRFMWTVIFYYIIDQWQPST